ncbi:MAG: hypothetical protein ABIP81_06075 [Terriglobales bacterium]
MTKQSGKDMNPPSTAERINPQSESEPRDHHDHKDEVRKVFPYSVHEESRTKASGR